jgi:hydroxyacyl-ACP dehydratase HTD2-like protein with hotdog domain
MGVIYKTINLINQKIYVGRDCLLVTEKTKEKLRISNQNKTQKHSIKLECKKLSTGEIFTFNNVEHARRELGCTRYQLLQNKLPDFEVNRIE